MKFSPLVLLGGLTLALADATATASCPPAGQTNAAGDYSCNPAHEYPSGQACALIGDCYFLRGMGVVVPTSTSAAQPSATCPPAGQTNAAGDYSCNPAHQYPNGQVCALIGGCYFLRGTGLQTSSMGGMATSTMGGMTQTTAAPAQTSIVIAGAGRMQAAGGLFAAAVAGALLL